MMVRSGGDDEVRQGYWLSMRALSKTCNMTGHVDVHHQDTILETGEDCSQKAGYRVRSLNLPLAPQLQGAGVHFRDSHHRYEEAGAIPLKPRNEVGSVRMTTRIEHRDDVGIEQIHLATKPVRSSAEIQSEGTFLPRPIDHVLCRVAG